MPVTDSLSSIAPYKNEGLNKMYELLFCDNIELYRPGTKATAYPWNTLLSEHPDNCSLKTIISDNMLETRHKLLAYRLLLQNAELPEVNSLLGVIIEVGLPAGLDVIAAYHDGTARYLNHAEKLLVWETQTPESDEIINKLFTVGNQVVSQIGKWEGERKPFPKNGMVRLNFLVSDGLYFGEGPFEVLHKEAMGGPVIDAAMSLMSYLINQSD